MDAQMSQELQTVLYWTRTVTAAAAANPLYISLKNNRPRNAGMKKSLASAGSYVLALLVAKNLQSINLHQAWAAKHLISFSGMKLNRNAANHNVFAVPVYMLVNVIPAPGQPICLVQKGQCALPGEQFCSAALTFVSRARLLTSGSEGSPVGLWCS